MAVRNQRKTVEKPPSVKISNALDALGRDNYEVQMKPKRETAYVQLESKYTNPAMVNFIEDDAEVECFAITCERGNIMLRFDTNPDRV